ncbi:LytR/AlgR family response regulator transcription factor [Merdibacter massiliensis]|uniref:LytR/AlgR family response regulator transcription factor n=1 Tax=Merdibacter massiliensis TaxID=1871030 RepID=UPI00096A7DAF|nr:LytTR family DNA-binding domain-containing protein [Merdibacter massiliensis]
MIKFALLENERTAKDIIYALGQLLFDREWLFRCYLKASELAVAQQKEHFDVVILNEKFANARIESVFVKPFEDRIIIYVDHGSFNAVEDERHQTFSISADKIYEDLSAISEKMFHRLAGKEEYVFSYNKVRVILNINDIYYLSKEEKLVCFHTRRGLFSERASMNDMENKFAPYGFQRIHASFLVNMHHVFGVDGDMVLMDQQDRLPLSRSNRQRFLGIVERNEY